MVAAVFVLAAAQDCGGDPSSPRTYTLTPARNANVASFTQMALETCHVSQDGTTSDMLHKIKR
jgi:hypothetical protein